jgi:hypothetical protein
VFVRIGKVLVAVDGTGVSVGGMVAVGSGSVMMQAVSKRMSASRIINRFMRLPKVLVEKCY